ncbi:MAG: MATE family efflux transporter, partial [Nevskia sp.]|nr:MATE family efflux transporter [Nevskia sp.]
LSFASSALVGQNYGAKLGTRVRETYAATLKLGLISMLGLVVLAQLMPETLIRGFTEDAGVIAAGVRFLNIISFNLLAVSVAFACFGVLSGLGNTVPTLISTTTRFSFIVVTTLLLIHYDRFEVARLWWLSVAGTVVQMLMNLAFLRRELRLKFGPAEAVAVPST